MRSLFRDPRRRRAPRFQERPLERLEGRALLAAVTMKIAAAPPPTGATATVTPNQPPTATNDRYTLGGAETLKVDAPGLLANYTDPQGLPLTAVLVSQPSHGTLTIDASGSFNYTPAAGFSGADSFTFKANDGFSNSNTAMVNLTVTPDRPPVAYNGHYDVSTASLVVARPGLLQDVTDPDSHNTISVMLDSSPAHGQLALNPDGTFTYAPVSGFSGPDSFTYRAFDGVLSSDAATVTLSVTAPDPVPAPSLLPAAADDSYTVAAAGSPTSVPAPGVLDNDTSLRGFPLTAALVAGPAHGTLALAANGSFTYTPAAGFSGADSFTYRANDGTADGNLATVALDVSTGPVGVAAPPVTAGPVGVAGPPATHGGSRGDFSGDGMADAMLYLPAYGAFALRPSGSGPDQVIPFGSPGAGNSIPVPGDYTGSGHAELAVYLPQAAAFAYRPPSGPDVVVPFGIAGAGNTIPTPGDYFGTGRTDIAAYLPAYGAFALRNPAGGPDTYVPFGVAGPGQTIPTPGDYFGTGQADVAAYLPAFGAFALRNPAGGPDTYVPFGMAGPGMSIPVTGDFDGSGHAELAVYMPSTGIFAYRPARGGPDVLELFGVTGPGQTLPAPGDYTGVGHDQFAAYLPASGTFAIRPGGGRPDLLAPFGIAGMGQSVPVEAVNQALVEMASITPPSPTVSASTVALPELSGGFLATATARKKAQG